MFLRTLTLLMLTTAAAPALRAQSDAAKALLQLRRSETVRVFTDSGAYTEGPIWRLRRDTLILGRTAPLHTVRVSRIDSLWVRTWSSRKGAIIGASSLAGAAAFLAWAVCNNNEGECSSIGTQALTAVVIGAPLGAAIGAVLGTSIPSGWRLVLPP